MGARARARAGACDACDPSLRSVVAYPRLLCARVCATRGHLKQYNVDAQPRTCNAQPRTCNAPRGRLQGFDDYASIVAFMSAAYALVLALGAVHRATTERPPRLFTLSAQVRNAVEYRV